MYFNSYKFIFLFLPITVYIFFLLNRLKTYRVGKIFLLICSAFFYACFNIKALGVISVEFTINYVIGKTLTKENIRIRTRKIVLIIGIIFNIVCLAYFKYYNFFFGSLADILQKDYVVVNLLVPIGISFFTFQQLAFLVDCFKEKITYSYIDYALHSIFFPYIISGPIVRHDQIICQFNDQARKSFSYENFAKGFGLFAIGMSKKVLIADTLAKVVNVGYADVSALNSTSAIVVMLSYTFQIYFDFSGYSDMAVGIGKMLNFDLPINFNSPYKACTIGEFWKRWHMSLTGFLTKYLYIPLGGNRKGKIRTYINVLIVFFISGIWHGANWTYIVWGLMHGIASVFDRVGRSYIEKCSVITKWIATFGFVNFSWIMFRAANLSDAVQMTKLVISGNYGPLPENIVNAFMLPEIYSLLTTFSSLNITTLSTLFVNIILCVLLFICLQTRNAEEITKEFKYSTKAAFAYAFLMVWSILSFTGIPTFIYVNF